MTDESIPVFQFSSKHLTDIPFQIIRFEEMPDIATQAFPRRRAFYEIFWITEGVGTHHIDFEAYTIIPNTLYFVTPGQVAFWELEGDVQGFSILFTQDFMATNLLEQITLRSFDFYHNMLHHPFIHVDDENAWIFTAICEHMFTEYDGKSFGRYSLLQCQLITLMIHAQRHYTEPHHPSEISAGDKLINHYLQLIDDHFREVQSVHGYANLLGVTAGHLSDVVRQHLDSTPIQLLNKRIALEAQRQLIYSEQTIAEIGLALNFDNPSYFSRFFKREVGSSPSAFRHKFREKYHYPRS